MGYVAIINDLIRSQEDSHRVRQSTVRKIVHESAIYRLSVVRASLTKDVRSPDEMFHVRVLRHAVSD